MLPVEKNILVEMIQEVVDQIPEEKGDLVETERSWMSWNGRRRASW